MAFFTILIVEELSFKSLCLFILYSRRLDNVDEFLPLLFPQVMALSRELEELRDQLTESERIRKAQLTELEDVMSSKDDVGKNVRKIWSL